MHYLKFPRVLHSVAPRSGRGSCFSGPGIGPGIGPPEKPILRRLDRVDRAFQKILTLTRTRTYASRLMRNMPGPLGLKGFLPGPCLVRTRSTAKYPVQGMNHTLAGVRLNSHVQPRIEQPRRL